MVEHMCTFQITNSSILSPYMGSSGIYIPKPPKQSLYITCTFPKSHQTRNKEYDGGIGQSTCVHFKSPTAQFRLSTQEAVEATCISQSHQNSPCTLHVHPFPQKPGLVDKFPYTVHVHIPSLPCFFGEFTACSQYQSGQHRRMQCLHEHVRLQVLCLLLLPSNCTIKPQHFNMLHVRMAGVHHETQ